MSRLADAETRRRLRSIAVRTVVESATDRVGQRAVGERQRPVAAKAT
jgi:hypothetical protein